jgi:hypothetical protein
MSARWLTVRSVSTFDLAAVPAPALPARTITIRLPDREDTAILTIEQAQAVADEISRMVGEARAAMEADATRGAR